MQVEIERVELGVDGVEAESVPGRLRLRGGGGGEHRNDGGSHGGSSCRKLRAAAHRPRQAGARFSRNALMPSCASSAAAFAHITPEAYA